MLRHRLAGRMKITGLSDRALFRNNHVTQASRVIFSVTDLINHLGYRHTTFLDVADLRQTD
jgi:hypothetical protein